MADQTEEPMGAFVDTTSEQAIAELGQLRERLVHVLGRLEAAGPDYAPAWRILVAGEAVLDHGIARLSEASKHRHEAWQQRQVAARAFLELRAVESGRRFRVVREHRAGGDKAKRYQNIPQTGTEFYFEIIRVPSLTGGRYGLKVRLESAHLGPGGFVEQREQWEMPLQALHLAFEEGAIYELDVPPGRPRLRVVEASDDPANRERIEELRLHLEEGDASAITREAIELEEADFLARKVPVHDLVPGVEQSRGQRRRLELQGAKDPEVRRG